MNKTVSVSRGRRKMVGWFALIIVTTATLTLGFSSASTAAANSNTLSAGETLTASQRLVSENGNYELVMQGDGNLVLYNLVGVKTAIWATWTQGQSGNYLKMQGDGNLVVQNGANVRWHSETFNHAREGAVLELSNAGHLRVKSSSGVDLWNASTGLIVDCRIDHFIEVGWVVGVPQVQRAKYECIYQTPNFRTYYRRIDGFPAQMSLAKVAAIAEEQQSAYYTYASWGFDTSKIETKNGKIESAVNVERGVFPFDAIPRSGLSRESRINYARENGAGNRLETMPTAELRDLARHETFHQFQWIYMSSTEGGPTGSAVPFIESMAEAASGDSCTTTCVAALGAGMANRWPWEPGYHGEAPFQWGVAGQTGPNANVFYRQLLEQFGSAQSGNRQRSAEAAWERLFGRWGISDFRIYSMTGHSNASTIVDGALDNEVLIDRKINVRATVLPTILEPKTPGAQSVLIDRRAIEVFQIKHDDDAELLIDIKFIKGGGEAPAGANDLRVTAVSCGQNEQAFVNGPDLRMNVDPSSCNETLLFISSEIIGDPNFFNEIVEISVQDTNNRVGPQFVPGSSCSVERGPIDVITWTPTPGDDYVIRRRPPGGNSFYWQGTSTTGRFEKAGRQENGQYLDFDYTVEIRGDQSSAINCSVDGNDTPPPDTQPTVGFSWFQSGRVVTAGNIEFAGWAWDGQGVQATHLLLKRNNGTNQHWDGDSWEIGWKWWRPSESPGNGNTVNFSDSVNLSPGTYVLAAFVNDINGNSVRTEWINFTVQ